MKKLDYNERKLCQMQGKLFEKSICKVQTSSLIFIRRFMLSDLAKSFDNKTYLIVSLDINDCFHEIEAEYGKSSYGKIKYNENEMYWIGYIYRAISFLYKLPSKRVFSLFNAKEIVKYYNIYHTFDIEQAAERMMENINYTKKNFDKEGYKILKKLIIRENLEKMIGKKTKIYIDRPIGSRHPNNQDIIYPLNYGYIKEVTAVDNEYQDAYLLGVDDKVKEYEGIIYAIIERENDYEDKLVIVPLHKEYSIEEIKKITNFQEKYFKTKIYR